MRIGLLNNQYFRVGGTTTYLFNVERLLQRQGHQVVPFSNRFAQSVESPYSHYFVTPPGGEDAAALFRDAPMTLKRASSLFVRGVYDLRVRRNLETMLRAESIEVVYSINICNLLGPSVIDAARSRGIPYVLRLSDFNLTCPAYHHLRQGEVCEACRAGLWNAVRYRCLQNSTEVSLARVLAMWAHRITRVYHRVSAIVTPSAFLRGKLIESGYDAAKIEHIPSFVDLELFRPREEWSGQEIVFTGRLAPEKGPEVLIRAAAKLPAQSRTRVVFIGGGDPEYVANLKSLAGALVPDRIEFTGQLPPEQLRERLSRACALALPARWFENMPNSITEAMALARPVLCSPLGSLPEQVEDGETGMLIPPDDESAWAAALERLSGDSQLVERLGRAGRLKAEREYAPDLHYRRLLAVFEQSRQQVRSGAKK